MYGVNHFIVSQVMPGLGREPNLRPGIRKITSDASVAATKEVVRGCLDFIQRYATVGPRLGVAMNAINALIDQRFTADINIFPGYGASSLGMILQMLSEEEMAELIKAGERATWPKIPAIRVTTRIGRTLDRILHAFEVDEAHWLQSAPQTDAALADNIVHVRRKRRSKTAPAKRGKRAAAIIESKVDTMSRG
jgi:NTE family protein